MGIFSAVVSQSSQRFQFNAAASHRSAIRRTSLVVVIVFALLAPALRLAASTVHGRVVDGAGRPISGAGITIEQVGGELPPWLTTTDADGLYSISDPLLFGNLHVTASKPGRVMIPPAVDFFDGGLSTLTADFTGHTNSPVSVTSMTQANLGLILSADANPLGFPTTAFFEFGVAPGLNQSSTPVILNGSTPVPVTFTVATLPHAGVPFHGRLIVSNALGRVVGPTGTFLLPDNQQFASDFVAPTSSGTVPWGVQAGDVDGDGRMDFFRTGTVDVRNLAMFRGTGPEQWVPADFCSVCTTQRANVNLRAASWLDWNRDNRPDLIGSDSFGKYTVLTGTGAELSPAISRFLLSSQIVRLHPVDLNGDGREDIVSGGESFLVATQAVDGLFGNLALNIPDSVANFIVRDLDNNGIPDTAFVSKSSSPKLSLFVQFGTGNGRFDRVPPDSELVTLINTTSSAAGLEAADLDGDGALDLVLVSHVAITNLQVQILWNDGRGAFPDRHITTVNSTTAPNIELPDMTTGDFDNDGREDVVLSATKVFLITGRGRNVRITEKSEIAATVAQTLRFDADSDGRLDLVTVRQEDASTTVLQVFRNNTPTVNQPPAAPAGFIATAIPGGVRLSWEGGDGDDLTPTPALTWNVRVGTSPGGTEILSPLSELASGRRRVLRPGNAGTTRFINLALDPSVTRIFWSVQAQDAAYEAGPWATEQTFAVPGAPEFRLTQVIFDANGTVRVRGAGAGANAVLFSSEDLVHWSTVVPFQAVNGEFEAVDASPMSKGPRFYMTR